jgi:glycosyltransferase involved in cell wall biosynthesis
MGFHGEINPVDLFRIYKAIKLNKIDIVHSHEAHSLTPLLILKMLGASFKLVHTRRVDFNIKSKFKYINKHINLVAISQGVKRVLTDDGVDPKKIDIIYSGTPAVAKPSQDDVAEAKHKLGLDNVAMVFGTVANFSPHKDLPTMLRAYEQYRKRNGGSKLLMVGDGPLMAETASEAKRLKIEDDIIFTGFRTDVATLVSCMDIYLVSSEREGLNTSIIDAMHLARPVIATDAGGIGELVEDNVTGYLVHTKDYEDFAKRMEFMDWDKRKTFGENAAIKAECFTDAAMVDGYIKLYKRLLS